MDRIFLNRVTGQMLLSVEDGFLREDVEWTQIGTIDTDKVYKESGNKIAVPLRGRVTIS